MRRAAGVALLCLLAACTSDPAAEPAPVAAPSASSSAAPGEDVLWLCAPELADDPCDDDVETAAVLPDGSVVGGPPVQAVGDPGVDCLYLYPTVSDAPGANAPLEVEPSVVATVRAQALRFREVCTLHVPVYRQLTRASLLSGEFFRTRPRDTAYADVRAAWDALVARDPDRGIVLVGHSQGAMMLTRLVAERVSGQPVRERLVSALLIGGGVSVPAGRDAGGDTGDVPVCREVGQTACVVAYSSFLDVPPPGAFFGRAPQGREAVCTDPSRLAGGDGTLHPYFPTSLLAPGLGAGAPVPGDTDAAFVTYRDAGRAQCRTQDGASWLQVTPVAGAPLPAFDQRLGPEWGLHVADVNLALGDLVEVVRRQAATWQSSS